MKIEPRVSKLTDEQLTHYLKGGKFRAIYNPTKNDISSANRSQVGKTLTVEQNMLNGPIQLVAEYRGQHAFNSPNIGGWFPEEDIEIVEILQEFKGHPEPVPVHLYRMHYTTREQLVSNFGVSGNNMSLPYMIGRQYGSNQDEYVLKSLSDPPADRVERAIWDPKVNRDPQWEDIS